LKLDEKLRKGIPLLAQWIEDERRREEGANYLCEGPQALVLKNHPIRSKDKPRNSAVFVVLYSTATYLGRLRKLQKGRDPRLRRYGYHHVMRPPRNSWPGPSGRQHALLHDSFEDPD